ncbi:MAG: hypothetical protein IJU61_09845 [Victivallales bacterium]|nr:hypothetical protein [Victivallales bacterium]
MSFTGFVNKTYCNMLSWQWYHNLPVRVLFDHLLRFIGNENNVNNGSVLISIDKLAKDSCLTINQVRLALIKLESSNDVSVVSYGKKGSLITIKDWEKYQNFNHEENHEETTNKPQTQNTKNNDVTSITKKETTNKSQIKPQTSENSKEKTIEPRRNHEETTKKLDSQTLESNHNTNTITNDATNKSQTNHEQTQSPKEQESKESSPTPLKENKEEEKECEKEKNTKKEKPTNYPFELFWNTYDKKFDKQKCEKAWAKMSEEDRAACMKALPSYIASTQEIQYRRYPYTYLHNRSWENDIIQKSGGQQLLPLETPLEKALREFDNE